MPQSGTDGPIDTTAGAVESLSLWPLHPTVGKSSHTAAVRTSRARSDGT